MRIEAVIIHKLSIPFRMRFRHALKNSSASKNILVEVVSDNGGIRGYGEGAPRSFVTGESQDAAVDHVQHLTDAPFFPWTLEDVAQIWDFVDRLPAVRDKNTAICALEIALLDALGKAEDRPLIDFLGAEHRVDELRYGAVIPMGGADRIRAVCDMVKDIGIRALRIKMGRDLEQNRRSLETVREVFAGDCDLRIDVNGAWDFEIGVRHLRLIQDHGIRIIEQPMPPDSPDTGRFFKSLGSIDAVLMADESVCTLGEARKASAEGHYGMVNMRLSKCGGFRRSQGIIDYLRAHAIPFQVGCHLGESGVLSAAGRAFGLLNGDARYWDGSYDRLLLMENVTVEDVSFGKEGKAGPLPGAGLGVEISGDRVRALATDPVTVTRP